MLHDSVDRNTNPIEAAWIAVGHADLDSDIRELPGFIPTAHSMAVGRLSEHECGSVKYPFVLLRTFRHGRMLAALMAGLCPRRAAPMRMCIRCLFSANAYTTVPIRELDAVSPAIISAARRPG